MGQLVQVTRSDGSWTYGKIMEFDDLGGTYSVMTRAGAKHFVERAVRHTARDSIRRLCTCCGAPCWLPSGSLPWPDVCVWRWRAQDITDDIVVNPSDGSCAFYDHAYDLRTSRARSLEPFAWQEASKPYSIPWCSDG